MGSWASSEGGSVGPTGGSVTGGSDGLSVRTAGTASGQVLVLTVPCISVP